MDEYKERGPYHYPTFTLDYYTTRGFKKIKNIQEVKCALKLSVEKFRQRDFEYPKGIGSNSLIFIKKKSDSTYLVWDAISLD